MITEQEKNQIFHWLEERWGDYHCSVCNASSWQVETHSYQLMEYREGQLVVGGRVIPVIPLTCANCGNTILLNAIMCGAVNAQKEQKDGGAK